MKNKIEHYQHLYLGCRIVSSNGTELQLSSDNLQRAINENWRLLLRRLKDMTEEEMFGLCDDYGEYGDVPGRRNYESYKNQWGEKVVSWGTTLREKWIPIRCEVWTPNQFSFLLSKHFDVFGLIEDGLAIDATKQTIHY